MARPISSSSLSAAATHGVIPLVAVTPDGVLRATLDTEESATYLGVSKKTLENWRHSGLGPRATKLGRRTLWRIADLEEYLLAHRESE